MNTHAIPDPLRTGLAVGLGAGIGALARYAVVNIAAAGSTQEVLLTIAVNAIGCFLMGLCQPGPFFGTGVLGGFTTFSAVVLASVRGSAAFAAFYMVVSFVVCVGAWLLGDKVRGQHA